MSEPRVQSDVDLFSPDVVADPFPVLAELREKSAAVYMSKYEFWLLSRYEDVREATGDWEGFTSARGVALRQDFNDFLKGGVLANDPPEHDRLRAILSDKLAPRALKDVRNEIQAYAAAVAAEHTAKGSFDGYKDIAAVYPINVISDLIGLPVEDREKFHPGADATFAGFGPITQYLQEHFQEMVTYQQWIPTMADRSKLTPGKWGDVMMDAVDEGRIGLDDAVASLNAYLTAGMDTTVNALSATFALFAERPEIWSAVREDRGLLRQVLEEVLRLESPVTGFFRIATQDIQIDGTPIPTGGRVMLHWAAANRDPRHYPDPDTFDLHRNPLDHLAFGYGAHGCPGRGIAILEMTALFEAFIPLVEAFELSGPIVRGKNPVVRSLDAVPLTVKAN